jgi:hypothetical protein
MCDIAGRTTGAVLAASWSRGFAVPSDRGERSPSKQRGRSAQEPPEGGLPGSPPVNPRPSGGEALLPAAEYRKGQSVATMREPAALHGRLRRRRSEIPSPCGLGGDHETRKRRGSALVSPPASRASIRRARQWPLRLPEHLTGLASCARPSSRLWVDAAASLRAMSWARAVAGRVNVDVRGRVATSTTGSGP